MAITSMESNSKRDAMLQKTKLCKFFQQGHCSKAGNCQFAHSHSDLQSRPNLHKTQLCMAFERKGSCRDGAACKYAHGQAELLQNSNRASRESISSLAQVAPQQVAVQIVMLSTVTHRNLADWQSPLIPGAMIGVLPQHSNMRNCSPCFENGLPIKASREDDTWSVQTTDAGMELELESLYTGRQTSEWSSISEDDSSHQWVSESEYFSERTSFSDVSSDVSEDVSLITTPGMKAGTSKVPDSSLQRTKMCKFFLQGNCTKASECTFAHDPKALKTRPSLLRTSLCMAFERSGSCKMGEDCKYAHGMAQLRRASARDSQVAAPTMPSTLCLGERDSFLAHDASNILTHEASGVIVGVKNTFLHLRPRVSANRRRAVSCHI